VGVGALASKTIRTAMLGWGDVKLLLGLAATLGWWNGDAIFLALLLWAGSILVAAVIVALRTGNRQRIVPYGPALLAGTLGALAVAG
jgi:leader peptidase (prepilin peptidase)/N-methyltransferase